MVVVGFLCVCWPPEQAGDANVKVEYRGGAEERFGRGLERAMKFGDFVGELERKNDLLYLTTQVRSR